MKKMIIAASLCGLLAVAQLATAQGVQEGKAVKKEMKADKKMDKAREYRKEARTHAGLEIKGISDPKTRMAKAEKKEKKAAKKELKSDAKGLKAVAKVKTKQAAGVN